jgi:hypothetical protein
VTFSGPARADDPYFAFISPPQPSVWVHHLSPLFAVLPCAKNESVFADGVLQPPYSSTGVGSAPFCRASAGASISVLILATRNFKVRSRDFSGARFAERGRVRRDWAGAALIRQLR